MDCCDCIFATGTCWCCRCFTDKLIDWNPNPTIRNVINERPDERPYLMKGIFFARCYWTLVCILCILVAGSVATGSIGVVCLIHSEENNGTEVRMTSATDLCEPIKYNEGLFMTIVGICLLVFWIFIFLCCYVQREKMRPKVVVFYSKTLPWSKDEATIFGDVSYCIEDLPPGVKYQKLLTFTNILWLSCHDYQTQPILDKLSEFGWNYTLAIVLNTCHSFNSKDSLFSPIPILSYKNVNRPVGDKEAFLAALKLYFCATTLDVNANTLQQKLEGLMEQMQNIIQRAEKNGTNVIRSGTRSPFTNEKEEENHTNSQPLYYQDCSLVVCGTLRNITVIAHDGDFIRNNILKNNDGDKTHSLEEQVQWIKWDDQPSDDTAWLLRQLNIEKESGIIYSLAFLVEVTAKIATRTLKNYGSL